MYRRFMRQLLLLLLVILLKQPLYAQSIRSSSLPHRCISVGPLPLGDPTFCGCTWGEVIYRGQPIAGADITLAFKSKTMNNHTHIDEESEIDWPIYDVSGYSFEPEENRAVKGDVMTLTVEFEGQAVTRPFRAWPDATGEQHIPLVLPERGTWQSWITGGYTRTLAVDGDTLWAGGPAGIISVSLTNDVRTTHSLSWENPVVSGIVIEASGVVWAANGENLARFDGNIWQDITHPFADRLSAITANAIDGMVWVGTQNGKLAVYNGTWTVVNQNFSGWITTLAVDGTGDLWVGTWGNGAHRWESSSDNVENGWTAYSTQDGLVSDRILSIAADDNYVWFGAGDPYKDSNLQRNLGGIGRYGLTDSTWLTYTNDQGLPAIEVEADEFTAQRVDALMVDKEGTPWASTGGSLYQLATPEWWVDHARTTDVAMLALASVGETVIAGRSEDVWHLDQSITPGMPPTAQITSMAQSVNISDTFTLTASAVDNDADPNEMTDQILAWDWRSDRDGPLCTTAEICSLPATELKPGRHTVTLRVQDDEGVWSQPVTTDLMVLPMEVYLPYIGL